MLGLLIKTLNLPMDLLRCHAGTSVQTRTDVWFKSDTECKTRLWSVSLQLRLKCIQQNTDMDVWTFFLNNLNK